MKQNKFIDLDWVKRPEEFYNKKSKDFYNHRYLGFAEVIIKNRQPFAKWQYDFLSMHKSDYGQTLLKQYFLPDHVNEIQKFFHHGHFLFSLRQPIIPNLKSIILNDTDLYNNLILKYNSYFKNRVDKKNYMYFEDRDEIDQENGYQSIYYDLIKLIIYESIRSNDKIYNKYISIIDEFISNKRNCEICGSSYHVIDFPYWLYNNMSGNINLCYECPVTKPYKKDLKANIKKIIELCEFIPNSDFYHFSNDTFSSRIDSNKWTQIFQIILQLGCSINADKTDYIKKHFKSWFHALVESGILPKGQMITSRGIKCVAKSGNICLSLDEQYIDNYLHDKGYTFIKEPFYPFHEIYNQKKQLRADWIVKDTYIEYFGLKGESRYDEKIEKKIRLCHDLGIKLIEIYPRDLRRLNEIIVFDI